MEILEIVPGILVGLVLHVLVVLLYYVALRVLKHITGLSHGKITIQKMCK